MSDLPTEIEVGEDAYALRTFGVKEGRLTSIAQRGSLHPPCTGLPISHSVLRSQHVSIRLPCTLSKSTAIMLTSYTGLLDALCIYKLGTPYSRILPTRHITLPH